MEGAPIIVHPPTGTGGRRVTVRGQIVGLAYSDTDLLEFLRRAGLPDAETLLDDEAWVWWRGGRAHEYDAA
ncbi:hypothetical protein [Streptomyces indicus]|uniref:Uncharacterized protein n=1 Tax=Streptomyces indicus TaxID=417292 RepID=A0A1G9IQ55_9ACTN|nr:hypothetical protein [Streptomyces indicus]SDL27409.1 hypothetical protein SAMN05421806_1257 [Streptomyces indicus]